MISLSPLGEAQALSTLLASTTVFAALVGLGRLPGRAIDRIAGDSGLLRLPVSLATGWAIAAVVSAAAAPFGADQRLIALAILGLGLASLLPWGAWRAGLASEDLRLLRDLAVIVVLALPLAWLAARTPAAMFDEFAQWLPNTRYLVEHGAYWLYPDWIDATAKPGYPNGSTVTSLLASQISGPFADAYFKAFVVLATAGLGFVLAFVSADRGATALPRLIGLGVLFALANPFFDPRIALTSYTDAPTGVLLAVAGAAAAAGIGAARRGRSAAASGWFARSGACCAALTMLRDTNVVLVGTLALTCVALNIAKENRRLQALWAALLLGPPVVGWGVWHLYLHVARIGPDLVFRPVATWDWLAPVAVLQAIFVDRLRGNPLSGGAALLIASLALLLCVILWRRLPREDASRLAPPRTLLVIVSAVSGCFILFLAVSYVGFFSQAEVAQAGSTWRYLTELGPLLLTGMAAVLASFWPKRRRPVVAGALGLLGAVVTLSLPVLGRQYYALDCRYPDMIAARMLTAELAPQLAPFAPTSDRPRRLAVVHPTMGDWMAHAMAYDLRWPVIGRSIAYRTAAGDGKSTEQWAWDAGAEALLDLTALDRRRLSESDTIPAVALVARPAERDAPWTTLATIPAQPLPRCASP